jgi:uncharacterized Zn-binding protein involved in type VI secretion
MPGAVRKNVDSAGGKIIGGSGNVFINNEGAVTVGHAVAGHGKKGHKGSKMAQGSSTVFVNGLPLSRAGDKAECGHSATGSSDVSAE